ncbi:hypothetical protein AXF42_Ash017346 [Apostasia shenzhenica]|uniref:Uncharacterized protein n=1 Tax=Apostasia shenzhenica TaxID=1088818 RepID=A0A2I0BDF3_9ASPA|nr:hypothetical protein AXF42_Ash017346 [Apostasia shenzhenica]
MPTTPSQSHNFMGSYVDSIQYYISSPTLNCDGRINRASTSKFQSSGSVSHSCPRNGSLQNSNSKDSSVPSTKESHYERQKKSLGSATLSCSNPLEVNPTSTPSFNNHLITSCIRNPQPSVEANEPIKRRRIQSIVIARNQNVCNATVVASVLDYFAVKLVRVKRARINPDMKK